MDVPLVEGDLERILEADDTRVRVALSILEENALLRSELDSMKERLGAVAVPLQWPIGAEDTFEGMIDLVEQKAVYYDDEDLTRIVEEIDADARYL